MVKNIVVEVMTMMMPMVMTMMTMMTVMTVMTMIMTTMMDPKNRGDTHRLRHKVNLCQLQPMRTLCYQRLKITGNL